MEGPGTANDTGISPPSLLLGTQGVQPRRWSLTCLYEVTLPQARRGPRPRQTGMQIQVAGTRAGAPSWPRTLEPPFILGAQRQKLGSYRAWTQVAFREPRPQAPHPGSAPGACACVPASCCCLAVSKATDPLREGSGSKKMKLKSLLLRYYPPGTGGRPPPSRGTWTPALGAGRVCSEEGAGPEWVIPGGLEAGHFPTSSLLQILGSVPQNFCKEPLRKSLNL